MRTHRNLNRLETGTPRRPCRTRGDDRGRDPARPLHRGLPPDTCQMWVLDTAGSDTAHGPYPSSRQAWMIANELNITCARESER